MPIDDRTTNRSYQLPNVSNFLTDDVARLRAALQAIDADVFARYTKTETDQQIANLASSLINGAPGALDTLNELAAAMGDDPNFAATVINALAGKAPLASPTFTGTPSGPTAAVDTSTVQLATTAFVIAQGYLKAASAASQYAALTGATFTGNITTPSVNGGPLAGFRNAIINGNFNYWQRGTSFSTLGYGADRFVNAIVGSACTMSRQSFALGQTDVPGNPRYFCRMAVTSVTGANNYAILMHRIEDVRTFAGQTITVSFYAKADTTRPIAIELNQWFGNGTGGSAEVTAAAVSKVTISSTWQRVTFTATVPSISGKTLATGGDDYLGLYIWFDAGSDMNSRTNSLGQQSGAFDIAMVQVERGNVATPFEQRPLATELELCRRYYEKSYDLEVAPGAATDVGLRGGSTFIVNTTNSPYAIPAPSVSYKVTKRATPTLSFWNRLGTANQVSVNFSNGWSTHPIAPVLISNAQASFAVYVGPNNISYAGSSWFHFTSSAEL